MCFHSHFVSLCLCISFLHVVEVHVVLPNTGGSNGSEPFYLWRVQPCTLYAGVGFLFAVLHSVAAPVAVPNT